MTVTSQPFLSQDKLINQPVGPLQDSASRRIYCYWIHCQFEGQLGDKMGPSTLLLRASRDHFEPLQCMRLGQVTHRHTAASTCGQSRAHTEPLCPSPPCLRPHPPASALPLPPLPSPSGLRLLLRPVCWPCRARGCRGHSECSSKRPQAERAPGLAAPHSQRT